jgi:hypothetical protein
MLDTCGCPPKKIKNRARHAPNPEQRTMATFPSTPVSPPMPELYPAMLQEKTRSSDVG